MPLLEAQAFLGLISLDPKSECNLAFAQPESASQFEGEFWDVVSAWSLFGKPRDGILLDCGMRFPLRASTGKHVPEFTLEMG